MTAIVRPEGRVLDAARHAPSVAIETLAPGDVLVLAPHADDETLGCGEAIVAARRAGRRVAVLLVTDGAASHPASRTHPPERLRGLRSSEFAAALRCLDGDLAFTELGFPDGGSDGSREERHRLVRAMTAPARRFHPAVIWTTWERDPHCDHVATARAARTLGVVLGVPVLSYVVWGRFGPHEPDGALHRFRDEGANNRKRRAAECYRSQLTPLITDDPDGFMMPPTLTEHFLSTPELFLL